MPALEFIGPVAAWPYALFCPKNSLLALRKASALPGVPKPEKKTQWCSDTGDMVRRWTIKAGHPVR